MILLYVVVLLSGIQMAVLRVLGEYMARGYIEAKQRPVYIVRSEYVDRATPLEEHKGVEKDLEHSGGRFRTRSSRGAFTHFSVSRQIRKGTFV